jgi:Protein of unknown function (DUF3054)
MTSTTRRYAWPIAVGADVLVVLVFATIGRANHHEGVTAGGVWHTAWPFLLGTALGLLVAAITRSDPLSLNTGIRIWLWTLVIGMVVRHTIGGGTPVAFVIVAAIVLAAFFLGWRAALSWQRWSSRLRLFGRPGR